MFSFHDLGQIVVDVEVGSTKEHFIVHLDLLRDHSTHFDDEINGPEDPNKKWTMRLSKTTPGVFKSFLDWLYFGRSLYKRGPYAFAEGSTCVNCVNCPGEVPKDQREKYLAPLSEAEDRYLEEVISKVDNNFDGCALYEFGVMYDIPKLRKAIVDDAYKFHDKIGYPWHAEVIHASRRLAPDSPLFRLLVDSMTSKTTVLSSFRCPNEVRLTTKFPNSVLRQLWLCGATGRKGQKELCAYHEHDQDEKTIARCKYEMARYRKRKREEYESGQESDGENEEEVTEGDSDDSDYDGGDDDHDLD